MAAVKPILSAVWAVCLALTPHLAAEGKAEAPAEGWRSKVAPSLLRDGSRGQLEFIVYLEEQADLSAGEPVESKTERGRHAVEKLQAVAARSQTGLLAALTARGASYRSYWIANLVWVRGSATDLELVARRDDVRRVEANPRITIEHPTETTPGPARNARGVEWNVALVRADEVWSMGFDGEGVVIAGQDTGYRWDHETLQSSYRGWDGVSAEHDYHWHDSIHGGGGDCGADSREPCDDHSHGTHTMGTMVGDDGGSNRIGVAPGARWIGCRNMDQGDGTPITYTECFQWFVAPTDLDGNNPDPAMAPHVINNSWSCPESEGCESGTLRTVVENTRAAGIVVVSSAGNGGSGGCGTVSNPPAIYDAAISVAATDSSDLIASFSSRGPVTVDGSNRLKPDVAAPGVAVRSGVRDGGYSSFSGTSMAGPHVAGLVALLLDARPDLAGQVQVIEEILRSSAVSLTTAEGCGGDTDNVPNHTYGHGRVDAVEMLTGDVDADESSNLDDCRPTDPGLWSAPGPASQLTLSKRQDGDVELVWSAPADSGGSTVLYDVFRSRRADDLSSAACLAGGKLENQVTDGTAPKGVVFYFVGTRNDCGMTVGPSSTGPRAVSGCP